MKELSDSREQRLKDMLDSVCYKRTRSNSFFNPSMSLTLFPCQRCLSTSDWLIDWRVTEPHAIHCVSLRLCSTVTHSIWCTLEDDFLSISFAILSIRLIVAHQYGEEERPADSQTILLCINMSVAALLSFLCALWLVSMCVVYNNVLHQRSEVIILHVSDWSQGITVGVWVACVFACSCKHVWRMSEGHTWLPPAVRFRGCLEECVGVCCDLSVLQFGVAFGHSFWYRRGKKQWSCIFSVILKMQTFNSGSLAVIFQILQVNALRCWHVVGKKNQIKKK